MKVAIRRNDIDTREVWEAALTWEVGERVARCGETLGQALSRLGAAVMRLEQAEKPRPGDWTWFLIRHEPQGGWADDTQAKQAYAQWKKGAGA